MCTKKMHQAFVFLSIFFFFFVGRVYAQSFFQPPQTSGNAGCAIHCSYTTSPGPQGPQGPQGYNGTQGPQGPQGLTGTQGPRGFNGTQGPQGPQGLTGAQGPRGFNGTQGPQGLQGPAGATGPQGPQGATGPQGPQGATGPQGPQGPAGVDATANNTDFATIVLTNCGTGVSVATSANVPFTQIAVPDPDGTSNITIISTGVVRIPVAGYYFFTLDYMTSSSNCVLAVAFNGTTTPYSTVDGGTTATRTHFMRSVLTNTWITVRNVSGSTCLLRNLHQTTTSFCVLLNILRIV